MQPGINLLYPATASIKKTKKGPNLLVIVLAATFILICPVVYGYLYYQEIGLNAQIAKANAEIKELSKPLPGELVRRPFIRERNDIRMAVHTIAETSPIISKLMDQIAAVTDPEVTLTSIDILAQPRVTVLSGTAPSHMVVARFMGNLQQSRYLGDSFINSSTVEFIENQRRVRFTIQIAPSEGVFK